MEKLAIELAQAVELPDAARARALACEIRQRRDFLTLVVPPVKCPGRLAVTLGAALNFMPDAQEMATRALRDVAEKYEGWAVGRNPLSSDVVTKLRDAADAASELCLRLDVEGMADARERFEAARAALEEEFDRKEWEMWEKSEKAMSKVSLLDQMSLMFEEVRADKSELPKVGHGSEARKNYEAGKAALEDLDVYRREALEKGGRARRELENLEKWAAEAEAAFDAAARMDAAHAEALFDAALGMDATDPEHGDST